MFVRHCVRPVSLRASRFVALILLGIASAHAGASARAAELVIDSPGYANAKGTLGKISRSGNYQLSRGDNYNTLFPTGYGTGLSNIYAGLNFGESRNSKSIEFVTKSVAEAKSDAFTQIWTAPKANAGYDSIRVYVNPTSGEKKGRSVQVKVQLSLQASVSKSKGGYNRFALKVNGAQVADYTTENAQWYPSFTVNTTLGGYFTIGMLGTSSASKGNSANQSWKVTLSVPTTVK